MKVICFMGDVALIKKIAKHLGLWQTQNHDSATLDNAHRCPESANMPNKENGP